MKKLLLFMLLVACCLVSQAQSMEVMSGAKSVFMDAQYLKFLDHKNKTSIFSRARATAQYHEQKTNLFTGTYLNYTTRSGLGGTALGRISSTNSGIDAGVHYFKAKKSVMVYALSSINLSKELLYSWFSILRFTPELKNRWKLYTSLELFSAFGEIGHLSSVQRIRFGVDRQGYQFGLAINLSESRFSDTELDPGIFLRKQF